MNKKPVPSIYIENYLSHKDVKDLVDHWPSVEIMATEDGLDRNFYELIFDDEMRCNGYWENKTKEVFLPMLYELAKNFAPLIALKTQTKNDEISLTVHRLMCLDAQINFIEHTPHSHLGAPNWVFTFLLYLDDDGREDRGTTLYEIENLDFDKDKEYIYSGELHRLNKPLLPAYKAQFKKGALFAFFDGPLSIHGSTKFTNLSVGRKIIRGHVSLAPNEVKNIYGFGVPEIHSVASKQKNRENGVINYENDSKVINAFLNDQIPNTTKKILFPSFLI